MLTKAAILATLVSVLCFDFFFVPPRFSLTVDQPQYLITFAVMLAVSLVISHLTNALREKALEAQLRASEAELLHALAQDLGGAVSLAEVVIRLNGMLGRYLHMSATLYLSDQQQGLHPIGGDGRTIGNLEQMIANGVFASGLALHANPDLRDDAYTLLLPLPGGAQSRGVLGLYEPRGEPVRDLPETLCTAIAALVATVIDRIQLVDNAQANSLDMQSERLRGAILETLSRDLRTPVAALSAIADGLVARDDLPPDARDSAMALREQSFRLQQMLENILQSSPPAELVVEDVTG